MRHTPHPAPPAVTEQHPLCNETAPTSSRLRGVGLCELRVLASQLLGQVDVVDRDGRVIGRGRNRRESGDPLGPVFLAASYAVAGRKAQPVKPQS